MISTHEMIPYQVSKWLQLPVLIDADEMERLLDEIQPQIFLSGRVIDKSEILVSHQAFLKGYTSYVEALKAGELPEEEAYRGLFSSVWTLSNDAVYAIAVGEDKVIVKPKLPVVQLQAHRLGYSEVDGKIRSMALGPDTMSWGVQFSYPQIYQDPNTLAAHTGKEFTNWELYRSIQKWVRKETIPTPFLIGKERINHPTRLGKRCLRWINSHPQLEGICIAQK